MKSLKLKKRGAADAAGAATLIAIIGALIILYILFIPPAYRQELLEGNITSTTSATAAEKNNTLVDERPGRLLYLSETEYEHDIPSFNLFRTVNSQVLATSNPFVIKNNWFDRTSKKFVFQVPDISNTENVLLSFSTPVHRGALQVMLNGNIIFEQALGEVQVSPLALPKSLLASSNTLEFSVSGVGMAFWSTNTYSVKDIQLIGEVTDLSRQSSSSIFVLKQVEKQNLDTASLKFTPECSASDAGVLEVSINNVPVFTSVPDCKVRNIVNIPQGILLSNENKITFKTYKGSYVVDQIEILTKLKKDPLVVYYFDLNSKQYGWVQNNTKKVQLDVTLVRTDDVKEANFIINGHIASMWTRGYEFHKTIDKSWLLEGSNYVRIEPKTDLDVAQLKLYLN